MPRPFGAGRSSKDRARAVGQSQQLTTIQAGRGLAALAVVTFHLSVVMGVARYGGTPVLQKWTHLGHLGVDFFFVLSGFVILMAHHDDIGRPAKLRPYLWKRFIRVYPIYLLYTFVLVALVLAGVGNSPEGPMPNTAAGWVSSFTLIRFSPEYPPIGPAWTLFHEVAFYVIFAALIVNRRAGALIIASWLAVCIALWHYPPEDGMTAAAVYLSAYSVHFGLGMLAYLAYRHLRWRSCMALGGVGLGVLGATYYVGHTPPFAWACGFSGLLLISASTERQFGIRAPAWLRYLGDSSYSLYLLHLAFLGLLLKVAMKIKLTQAIGGVGTYLLVLVGATLLACLAYRLVEAPMLRALRSGIRLRWNRDVH